jgi:PAS domain S-box-containing protein
MNAKRNFDPKDYNVSTDTSTFFESLLKNSGFSAICVLDQWGKFIDSNQGLYKYYGYSIEDLYGKDYSVLFTEEDQKNRVADKELAAVVKNGFTIGSNYILHKNGTPIWTQAEIVLVKDKNDQTYFVKIAHDIDQQKLLEDFLVVSEARQSLLLRIFDTFINGVEVFKSVRNNSGDIIDFEYMMLNKAAERIIGKSRNELVGKKLLKEFPQLKDMGIFELQKRVVLTEKSENASFYLNAKVNIWFKAAFSKFGDGVIVTFEDVSDKEYISSELQKTTSQLLTSQEQGNICNFELNIKTGILTGTPELKKLYGFKNDPIYLDQVLKLIVKEDRERAEREMHEVIYERKRSEMEYKIVLEDGTEKYLFVKAAVFLSQNNVPEKIAGTIVDVTNTRKVEKNLKQAQDTLSKISSEQEVVSQRTEELLIANKQLKKIIEELDKYAYMVSHDLRAPLNSVEGLLFLLGEDYKNKPLDSEGEEMIDLINIKIQNMKELIMNVLKSAKVKKNTKETVNLYQVVHEVIQTLNVPSHISIYVAFDLPIVQYNRISLIRVFQNLIGNAIKFMDKDKGTINISCKSDDNGYYEVCVSDNGPGIPKDKLNQIFNIYEVGHTNENIESHGLGLSIVKKLVEENGGIIWVNSKEGIGTDFYFTIPQKK